MAKKAGRRAGLSTLSVADLQRELRRRQGTVGRLMKRRERLAAKLAALDAEIGSLGVALRGRAGAGIAGGRIRPKNDMKLVDALVKVLTNKTMSVTEVAEAVQEAGYRTSSSSFRTIVNQTLINSGKFKRVGRGQYTAK